MKIEPFIISAKYTDLKGLGVLIEGPAPNQQGFIIRFLFFRWNFGFLINGG
jgi:hypothetical protein